MKGLSCTALLLTLLAAAGCVTNAVSGQREHDLVGDAGERAIGEEHDLASRQMEGGDYRLDPELERYVATVGQRLAEVSDRPLDYEFRVLNNSTPDAWALPGGKIAINRGLLLELNNEAELAAVLSHEVVHAAARHGVLAMQRGLLQGALLATAIAASDSDYAEYVVGGAQIAAGLVNQRYSRDAELEADHYGMIYMARAGYDPQGAVALQKSFVRLSENQRSDWLSGLFASHPPSAERVAANLQTAAMLEVDGQIGQDRYRAATAQLQKTRPAYEAYDAGRKALAAGKPDAARAAAAQALEIEPREALFHGLLGDVAFALRDYQSAIGHYDAAIARNDAYFKFYLGRGESHRRLGHLEPAQADLEASVQLLPTADATTALGQLAESQGQIDEAISLYEVSAASPTPAGRQSVERLVRLDLPRRPDRYVNAAVRVDRAGRLYVELVNHTAIALTDLRLVLAWRDDKGQVRRETRLYDRPIAGGESGILMLDSRYVARLETLQGQITSARPAP